MFDRGSAALHYAALIDNVDMMEALIKANADPGIVNAAGFKPSQFAGPRHASLFKVVYIIWPTHARNKIIYLCTSIPVF